MASKPKQPAGPPMTLGNMRALGVQHLIAYCHNDACRHHALIDVTSHPDDVEVPLFARRARCGGINHSAAVPAVPGCSFQSGNGAQFSMGA
jgi:hypothetical protein